LRNRWCGPPRSRIHQRGKRPRATGRRQTRRRGKASNGFGLVRLNESDGSLDSGFGIGGVVLGPFATYGWAHALALRPDGGIIAAGHDSDGSSVNFIALAQYNSD